MSLVQIEYPIRAQSLPYLTDGFVIPLDWSEWGALFPRHHLMWVSPDFGRARDFVKTTKRGSIDYNAFLSDEMKASFENHYLSPLAGTNSTNLFPKGQVLDASICFLPTNDCNLGCKYCFSSAQPKRFGAIPWEIAKAGIDLGIRNAVLNRMRTGSGELTVHFFGGGEPTEYWETFSSIVQYARERAQAKNVGLLVATITNGQVDEEHFAWFRKNIDEVTISMDGPPDIQNAQRPTFAGEKSFDRSWKFVCAMDELAMNIKTLRVTVTAQTVHRMPEIAEFFWENLRKAYPVQFEPVYFSEVGRRAVEMPQAADFIEHFHAVEEMVHIRCKSGKKHGIVGTATRPLAIRETAYCDSLEGKGLFVTPNGALSLCSEISTPNDPRKDDYFIGSYDFATKQFSVSEEGASKVRCGPPWWCRGCYAQFSCRGGCEPRSQNQDRFIRKWWCHMVRGNLRNMWTDVRAGKVSPRARIGDPQGEELIWLPIWEESASMD